MEYIAIIVSAIFISNIVLAQYLGNCPFIGVSKRMDTAIGMGFAVLFTITVATTITWILHYYLLVPLGLEYLQTIVFILVIASLVQFIELFLKKFAKSLYQALGIFLPLITTNCAVLGVAILVIRNEYDFISSVVYAIASAFGYGLALVLFAGIRERIRISPVPSFMQDTAIALVTVGFMSLAFMGFAGM